ncbi:4a-hydroxytetrahydrobiopterin dehydratase [Micromonospora sp. NBC_01796]|uniref:4a-hydroxytetrahydrobiopterin dehydratase n=1 Tax=Micromonospora sp. NBC_01796 TaxID=2975987 RepID=UPI002DD9341F|nr:4a-hydroxytetrahydrobiopterin dehydratase [Micromonospora sp. NBC_01796]WSA89469.1 4a-hydroxytetrahydrobiopterin dehydratase [Micromonospora sp. NBC_01796]
MAEVLDADAVRGELEKLDGWSGDPAVLTRTAELGSFPEAIDVVNRVAAVAEELDHHPDIDIRWRTVTFRCATHSVGGVTRRDFQLAQRIDQILGGTA